MKRLIFSVLILTVVVMAATVSCTCQNETGELPKGVRTNLTLSDKAGSPPLVNFFIARPPSLIPGEYSELSWNVSGATSVTIDQGIGRVRPTGTTKVYPKTNTTYVLTATNSYGEDIARARVIIMGLAPQPEPPQPQPQPPTGLPAINSFHANPESINGGQSTVLSWNVSNATTVTPSWKAGTVPAMGHEVVSPQANTQYTLTATNQQGSVQAKVTVTVAFQGPPSVGQQPLRST